MKRPHMMFVYMGGLGNLGDRAMALNLIRQFREENSVARIFVGPHTLDFMLNEFDLERYPYLSHCLSRWGSMERKFSGLSKFLLPAKIAFYAIDTLVVLILLMARHFLGFRFRWKFMEASLARTIAESDVIYFCGGGYITDAGKFESRTCLIMALFGALIGKPVIMSGQGLGPFDSHFSHWLLRRVIPRLELITFRDVEGSEQLLRRLGIHWKRGEAVGDDAMSLPAKSATDLGEAWEGVRFGVNFRISPFTPNLQEKVAEFTLFLDILANEYDWQINFFIFETWRPWEEELVQSIIRDARIENSVIHKTVDPREALYLTGKCHLGIGISYHYVLFCLKQGIPVIALYTGDYYRNKMKGLLQWYDREDWLMPVDQLQARQLAVQCRTLCTEREKYREELIHQTQLMAMRSSHSIDYALTYLQSGEVKSVET